MTLSQDGPYLAFTVADDGTGFDRATTPRGGAAGHRRPAGRAGGIVEIGSAPGHGTRVTGRVPATAHDASADRGGTSAGTPPQASVAR